MRFVHATVAAAALAALALTPAGASAASSNTVLPLPPLPPLPGPLPQIPLDTSALGLEYVTHLKTSGSEVVKRFPATLAVPKALDVDGNGTTDLTATLTLPTSSQFKLVFRRPSGATAKLPVSVEAVAADPTQGDILPRDKIAFGYDGRADTAPQSWASTIIAGSKDGATSVDVSTTTSGAGTSVRTLGGLFNGDALTRQKPLGGGVKYAPVPSTTSLGLTLSTTAAEVRAGASSPVTATADVEIGQSASRHVTATIQKLPAKLRLRNDTSAKTLRYSASGAVPAVGLRLVEGGGRIWTLDATRVPTEIGVSSGVTAGRTTAQVGSGAIGSATIGVATGEPERTDLTFPYVNVSSTSAVVRLDEIQQVVVDTAGGLGAEAQLAVNRATPLRAIARLGGKVVDGMISNLPAHFRAAYTPTAGRVFYNGYGTTIKNANVGMSSSTPFFGRVTRISGYLEGLPDSVTVNFKKSASGTGGAFTASPKVGLVEARLRSPAENWEIPSKPLADGVYGASLRDVPAGFDAFVRLKNVTGGELSQTDGRMKATLRTAPDGDDYQDIRLLATLNDPDDAVAANTAIDGFVRDLPPVVTVDQTAEAVTVTGSRAIPYATLSARNLPVGNSGESLHGKIHNLDATLTNLPATFTVEYGSTAQGVTAPSGYFGQIEFSAWDDSGAIAPSDDFPNYIQLDRRDSKLRVWGRVSGVRTAIVRSFFGITSVESAFGVPQSQVEFHLADGFSDNPVDMTAALLPVNRSDPAARIPTVANLQFVNPPSGIHAKWDANASSLVYVTMHARELSIDNLQVKLPPKAEICVGAGRTNCQPQSPRTFDGVGVELPNSIVLFTKATSPITVNGHICLMKDGEGVYTNCPKDDRYVILENLRLQTARIEAAKETDYDGIDSDYLKLHLDTDSYGVLATGIRLKLDSDLTLRASKPVRNVTEGTPFTGVSELGGKFSDAESKYRSSKMTCDGLSIVYHSSVGDFSARNKVIPGSWCA